MVVRRQTEKLGLLDRMNLWMHLSMCRLCSLFAKQNALIDKSVKELDEKTHNENSAGYDLCLRAHGNAENDRQISEIE